MTLLNTTLQTVVINNMFVVLNNHKQVIVSARTYEQCLQKLFNRFKNEAIALGSSCQ